MVFIAIDTNSMESLASFPSNLHRADIDRTRLLETLVALRQERGCLSLGAAERTARRFGFAARFVETDPLSLPDTVFPVILEIREGADFMLAKSRNERHEVVAELSDGRESVVSLDLVDRVATGRLLLLRPLSEETGRLAPLRRAVRVAREGWAAARGRLLGLAGLHLFSVLGLTGFAALLDRLFGEHAAGSGGLLPVYGVAVSLLLAGSFLFARRAIARDLSWESGIVDISGFALSAALLSLHAGPAATVSLFGAAGLFFLQGLSRKWRGAPPEAAGYSAEQAAFVLTALPLALLATSGSRSLGDLVAGSALAAITISLTRAAGPYLWRIQREAFAGNDTQPVSSPESNGGAGGGDCSAGKIVGLTCRAVRLRESGLAPIQGGVSFSLRPGERVAIFGESGAGKADLLHLLEKQTQSMSGDLRWNGQDIVEMPDGDWGRTVSRMGRNAPIHEGTIRSNLLAGNPGATGEMLQRAAERAGLTPLMERGSGGLDRAVHEGGIGLTMLERQKLCFGRAIVSEPQLLLLDEPAICLEPRASRIFYEIIEDYLVENPDAILVVATEERLLPPIATRVLVLSEGRIVADGGRDEMFRRILMESWSARATA